MSYFILSRDSKGKWKQSSAPQTFSIIDVTDQVNYVYEKYNAELGLFNRATSQKETWRGDFPNEPFVPQALKEYSSEQEFITDLSLVDASIIVNSLEEIKQTKLNELLDNYNTKINAGVSPTGTSVKLAAQETDRNKFNQLLTMLREIQELQPTEELRASFEQSEVTISDINDTPIQTTVSQVRLMILDYGRQINALWSEYAQKRSLIQAANSIDEVNIIS